MKRTAIFAAMLVMLVSGCALGPGPRDSTKYTLENTDTVVFLDKEAQRAVASTGVQYRDLSDGRLEVTASIKNRENRPVSVQVECVFRSSDGFPLGESGAWRTVELAANTTEAVSFTSENGQAKRYTLRVRQVR